MVSNELQHHGILGQKWGVRRYQNRDGSLTPAGKKRYSDDGNGSGKLKSDKKESNDDIKIEAGTSIHRMVPKEWVEREKGLTGRAYASYTDEDVKRYRDISRMFGAENYVDMRFEAKKMLVSPSERKRIDEMINLIDSDPNVRNTIIKKTRSPLLFVPKSYYNDLSNEKKAEKVYRRASYLLVSNKDIRDPYFDRLKKQGYNMIIDDADVKGGISKSPIIVFDREKTLNLKETKRVSEYDQ